MQGDKCTPEGKFNIISKYPHREWSKFIWINYPNDDSWKKHNTAKSEGRIPKNAQIGGEVGIHGVPKGMDFLIDTKYNWTLGCISLKNKDVDELYPFITKNTIIEIRK
jgi:murein L,D-transpeptidase YafK